jgi:TfoX/Sxy family transcriptional regulator of competence genes
MAYDEGLAERIRDQFQGRHDVEEKKMFGGLCFMLANHMCCGIVGDTLMVRVGPERYEECLAKKYARQMDFTGRPMKGMVYVAAEGLHEDDELAHWLYLSTEFVLSLPPKKLRK